MRMSAPPRTSASTALLMLTVRTRSVDLHVPARKDSREMERTASTVSALCILSLFIFNSCCPPVDCEILLVNMHVHGRKDSMKI